MSTTPSPAMLARIKRTPVPQAEIVADLAPQETAKIVRPGYKKVVTESVHDGIVKAKHLTPGQEVRAYLHGRAVGGVRTVANVERLDDGATIRVTFSSDHPVTAYKAAYRFFDASLEGSIVKHTKSVPALVAYEEV